MTPTGSLYLILLNLSLKEMFNEQLTGTENSCFYVLVNSKEFNECVKDVACNCHVMMTVIPMHTASLMEQCTAHRCFMQYCRNIVTYRCCYTFDIVLYFECILFYL